MCRVEVRCQLSENFVFGFSFFALALTPTKNEERIEAACGGQYLSLAGTPAEAGTANNLPVLVRNLPRRLIE